MGPLARAAMLAMLAGGLASSSGCALFASANAAHSRISPCVADVGYSVVDLVLAAGATAVLVGTGAVDESPAWMLVPGTFVASGVVGSIYAHRCRKRRFAPEVPVQLGPAFPPQAIEEGRVETEAEDRDTSVELGPPSGVELRLPEDSPLGGPAPVGGPLECGPALSTVCPEGQVCQLHDRQRGTCVPEAVPAQQL